MKVLVLGGGVVGVATAYHLAEDGHEVVVLERRAEPALEASAANAGLYAPGDSFAWASPDALKVLLKSLVRRDLGIRITRLDRDLVSWGWKFLLQCTGARARANTLRKLRLALYSRDCLKDVVEKTGVEFDQSSRGALFIYRTPDSFRSGLSHVKLLADNGLKVEYCDRDKLAEIEPALASVRSHLAGGVHSLMDQCGDCRAFSRNLAGWAAKRGAVRFLFETTVTDIYAERNRIVGVRAGGRGLTADAYVLALGAESPKLARRIGIRLPIYPVKGYSVTLPVTDPDRAPRLGGVDGDHMVAYAPLGDRLRVAARAEFCGYEHGHRQKDFKSVFHVTRELFPGAADDESAELSDGLRPMTPSSVPILGRARYENFYLNVGHGHLGWTLSCGAARFVADLVAGRQPDIDPEGLLYEG